MTEFKVKCAYLGKRKGKFFSDKEPREYHQFSVINANDLPSKYFFNVPKNDNWGNFWWYWLWISEYLVRKRNIIFEKDKEYQFIIVLGETKTANFKTKNLGDINAKNDNNMVLKTSNYFENTVKKIGFWDSENYFYELEKKSEKSSKNKSEWGKIFLACLPIIIVTLFLFLVIKRMSKNK